MENKDVNFVTVDPEKRRKARKAVSSMSLSDNAMFINAMKDKTLFEHVLRQIIGKEMEVIGEIESISTEFSDYLTGGRGVRLDAIAKDSNGNMYHIEMENNVENATALRGRYYAASIDRKMLNSGDDYSRLKHSISIFLVDGDPFGRGQTIYKFERKDQHNVPFNDHCYLYYVDINGNCDDENLQRLLNSFKESNTEKIPDAIVRNVVKYCKGDEDMEISIYDTKVKLEKEREIALLKEGHKQGLEEGLQKGLEEGLEKGKQETIATMVIKAYKRGSTVEEIVDFLEIPAEQVLKIIEIEL